jgi:hypothetical protein
MKYDLSNQSDRERLMEHVRQAVEKREGIVEFTTKKRQRSLPQNRYLHVILSYFASQYGESMEYVKEKFFKEVCNRDLFFQLVNDRILGYTERVRSTADLTTEEMSLAIERFRDFCAMQAGIYIPSPDEHRLLELAEIEVERHKEYV